MLQSSQPEFSKNVDIVHLADRIGTETLGNSPSVTIRAEVDESAFTYRPPHIT